MILIVKNGDRTFKVYTEYKDERGYTKLFDNDNLSWGEFYIPMFLIEHFTGWNEKEEVEH